MYPVDQDRVVKLHDIPRPSAGAPLPRLVTDEWNCFIAYNIARDDEAVAIVSFTRAYATMFGPPNDEAFKGHPLAARDLEPYGTFEVLDSSWVRQLERMNAVHRQHRPETYAALRHLILTFHDSTFECIAMGYVATRFGGSLAEATEWMTAQLEVD